MDVEGQPLLNESMMINLDFDNLGLSHLDFYNLETLVHKLPNGLDLLFLHISFLSQIEPIKDSMHSLGLTLFSSRSSVHFKLIFS